MFSLRFKIDFWTRNDWYCHTTIFSIELTLNIQLLKYLHESSAMACSLILLNELSNRIGAKHRWQAKLTLTLVLDIFYWNSSALEDITFDGTTTYVDFKTKIVVNLSPHKFRVGSIHKRRNLTRENNNK